MGRNLSPVVRKELANLDKDPDSRKSAMKALKSYVKDLDSNAIPLFLAQVSQTKEMGTLSGEYTISLYEVLARVHGVSIVSQIESIMDTIIKTLSSSAGSFPLQQACSKVVPAIARYGIDPTTPDDKKRHVIHSLCKPLSEALLGAQESLTLGAALCLKALVDCDNWRHASDEMVNKVCQNVAVALEDRATQTNSHMGLAMSLAKHNSLIVEAYARLLIRSGLRIVNSGFGEANSQKRLSAIQMINFLMKSLDARSIFSEVEIVIHEMEKCQSDQMAFVSGAAYEALQTAKKIFAEKTFKMEKSPASATGSNYVRKERLVIRNAYCSPQKSMSPESRTLGSFTDHDSFAESPNACNYSNDCRSVTRKLWRCENGGVDVSLKDGIFPGMNIGGSLFTEEAAKSWYEEREFAGFQTRSSKEKRLRSATPSPQRGFCHLNMENIGIFTTPRKLIRSLQENYDLNSGSHENEEAKFRSPCSVKFTGNYESDFDEDESFHSEDDSQHDEMHFSSDKSHQYSESVSSTNETHEEIINPTFSELNEERVEVKHHLGTKKFRKAPFLFLITLLAAFLVLLAPRHTRDVPHLVPT